MMDAELKRLYDERRAQLDAVSRRNMEKCAAFIAKMIMKYGRKVLAEVGMEDQQEMPGE